MTTEDIITMTEDEFNDVTLKLERASCLAETLFGMGQTFDIDTPWFENFLISFLAVGKLAEEAREKLIEVTNAEKREAA